MPIFRRVSTLLAFTMILTFTTTVALFSSSVSPVLAQGIIIPGPPEPWPRPWPPAPTPSPIGIELHSVDVHIDGPVATVHVSQLFRNVSATQVEGSYLFPLPADAAVSDFQMTVDGQVLEGQLLSKEEARRIYEEIVRRRLDPALLEFVDRGLFRTSVFPIPAQGSRQLEFTYRQVVPLQDGLIHFRYPLRSQPYTDQPVHSLAVRVELVNQPGLRTIYSPSHEISLERHGNDGALIGFEATDTRPDRDFDLYFGSDAGGVGVNVLSYHPVGEDGFFLLLAAPSVDVAPDQIVQRDVVLVLDVSGSMEGEKMEQAKQAARYVVNHLNPGDGFNLISFSTGVRLWQPALQAVNEANSQSALTWIDRLQAGGSTDINRALLEVMGQVRVPTGAEPSGRPATVLFLTDGLPTQGVTDPGGIRRSVLDNIPQGRQLRLFTFGLGFDVNTDLLDSLSNELGGRSSYVQPTERIDEKVSAFYSSISTPVLAGPTVDFGGLNVYDVYPAPLPDLFAGEQLILVGRYGRGGTADISLSGSVNGREQLYRYPLRRLVDAGGDDFVARLWATRKIGVLLDQIRREGTSQEAVDEVVKLSLAYGVVTPYTSYLVLEPGLENQVQDPTAIVAPRSLQADAAEKVQRQLSSAAGAPASGEAAVAASQIRNSMQSADRVEEQQQVRFVNGKTFTLQGDVLGPEQRSLPLWVDTLFDTAMTTETIPFGSDRYFALAADRDLAQWLAVSPELVVVVDGKALRITVTDEVASDATPGTGSSPAPTVQPTPVPSATPTPQPAHRGGWHGFLDWLHGLWEG